MDVSFEMRPVCYQKKARSDWISKRASFLFKAIINMEAKMTSKSYPYGWSRCPVCGNFYALKIPKGGDGSIHVLRLHTQITKKPFRKLCPGSNMEAKDEQ